MIAIWTMLLVVVAVISYKIGKLAEEKNSSGVVRDGDFVDIICPVCEADHRDKYSEFIKRIFLDEAKATCGTCFVDLIPFLKRSDLGARILAKRQAHVIINEIEREVNPKEEKSNG